MTSEWKEKVATRFDESVEKYDDFSEVQRRSSEKLAEMLPSMEVPDILEIGCGTGALTSALFEKYPKAKFEVTDISPKMLAKTRARVDLPKDTSWAVMDGENPVSENKFDLIVSNMTFQWFENPAESIEKLRSFLKPEGHIFYSVPGPESFKEWQSVLSQLGLESGVLNFSDWPGAIAEEEIVRTYDNALDFLRSVKAIGAGTARPDHAPLNYKDMMHACRWFDEEFQGHVSWQILYGSLA